MRLFCSTFILLSLAVVTQAGELRCLRPGAQVLSLYKDSRYFPGFVESLGESIDVTFQNGKRQSYSSYSNDVIVDDVPDVSELIGGSRVLARRPKSTSFEPGFVNGTIEGLPLNDTFLVNYDSGDSMARNIMEIRLATKPSSCMNEKGIYIGCFENTLNNYLTNYYAVNPTDVATCNWACFSRGFNFAGLQNGTWCFCGNHINDSLKVDDNECNIACRDSREDVCGGYERMTVYWTGAESSDNMTIGQSEFTESAGQDSASSPQQGTPNIEMATNNDCSDIYDTTQCNEWAENSRCIQDPDWMIANCKKSCYACDVNHHDNTNNKPYSSSQTYATDVVDQSQSPSVPSTYQPPAQTQPFAGYQPSVQSPYASNDYSSPQGRTVQASVNKSSHSMLNAPTSAGYLGCFKDSPSSHDLEYLADIKPLSIRACVTKCKSMRFPYAGVQSSSSCYCGLHYGNYGQTVHEDCNTPCEGDSSEMCGGILKNSLYNTGFALKFKNTEDTLTNRKNLPSPPKYQNILSGSQALDSPPSPRSIYPNPSQELASQLPQSSQQSYSQPTGYTPTVYTQPASPAQTTYNQVSYNQANRYPPAPTYNSRGGNAQQSPPAISPPSRQPPSSYSPMDSSSYGWRETYIKLRAQEQERSSRISRNKWRPIKISRNKWRTSQKSRKLNDVSQRKISGKTLKHNYRKAVGTRKDSKKRKTFSARNSSKYFKFQNTHSRHASKVNLKNTKKLQRVYHSTPKKGTRIHKRFGKPGIFLRKKAWKNNSFLAFLPHEVAKDESLLENVYSMLSQMLKNLRKHKKNTKTRSMKTLKQYLKLPGNEYQEKPIEKLSSKARHESTESLSGSGRFPKVTSKLKKYAKKLKLEELSSILHGQKQLDKEANDQRHPISKNSQWRSAKVMYLPSDNTSKVLSNDSFSDSHVAGKPSYVYKVIVRPQMATSDDDVTSSFPGTLDSRLRNHSANEYDSGLGTPPPPDSRRNSSTSFEEDDNRSESKVYRNASVDNRNVSEDHQNQSEDYRNESDDHRNESKKIQGHNKSFENGNKEYFKNKSSKSRNWLKSRAKDRKNWQKPRTSKTGFSNVSLRKPRGGKKKLNSASKLKGNTILKIDVPLVKVMKTNSTDNVIVEKSDEDIISSIVQVLEKEQHKRAERKRRKKYTSAKNKYSQGHIGNLTKHMKRISKKDSVQKYPRKDPTLMEEEEDYKVLKRS